MADRIDEVGGKLAKVGVGQLLNQVPMLGIIVETVNAFLPPNADERLKAAIEADLSETVRLLNSKVEVLASKLEAQGKKLDELGAVQTVVLTRAVAQSTTEAKTRQKRNAVLNAAARQFDPTRGDAAARQYWLGRVRSLPEVDLAFLLFVAEHREVGFIDDLVIVVSGPNDAVSLSMLVDFPRETAVAYRAAATRLGIEQGALVQTVRTPRGTSRAGDSVSFNSFALTPDGAILISFCKDD